MNTKELIEKAISIIKEKGTDGVYTFEDMPIVTLWYYEKQKPHILMSMKIVRDRGQDRVIVTTMVDKIMETDKLGSFDLDEIENIVALAR